MHKMPRGRRGRIEDYVWLLDDGRPASDLQRFDTHSRLDVRSTQYFFTELEDI
jgi:hypothetical protein